MALFFSDVDVDVEIKWTYVGYVHVNCGEETLGKV